MYILFEIYYTAVCTLMQLNRTHKRRLPDDDVHTSKHVGAVGS
jgi:hypothetical protein